MQSAGSYVEVWLSWATTAHVNINTSTSSGLLKLKNEELKYKHNTRLRYMQCGDACSQSTCLSSAVILSESRVASRRRQQHKYSSGCAVSLAAQQIWGLEMSAGRMGVCCSLLKVVSSQQQSEHRLTSRQATEKLKMMNKTNKKAVVLLLSYHQVWVTSVCHHYVFKKSVWYEWNCQIQHVCGLQKLMVTSHAYIGMLQPWSSSFVPCISVLREFSK